MISGQNDKNFAVFGKDTAAGLWHDRGFLGIFSSPQIIPSSPVAL
jgi:hypothetical protein